MATLEAFTYRDGELCAEDVALRDLAARHGTPLYVYSRGFLRARYRELAEGMREVDPLVCYSVKANTNVAVLQTFIEEGSGFDIVSGGELFRAVRAGVDPSRVVFAGVGKTHAEIRYALETGILFFTVESEPEARRISECAVETGTTGRIAFRINPDVDPQTHRYISTGKKENKFGLDIERTLKAYEMAAALPNVEIAGLHMHIGSQILQATPFREAVGKVAGLCRELGSRYPEFQYLDIGGGLGIRYEADQGPLTPAAYAEAVVPVLKELGLKVVMEPGRSLVGNAGVLLCRVEYVKEGPQKKFIVVDAGMNDLLRPSLYDAYHGVLPVAENTNTVEGDLVGPICESGDFIAADRTLPDVDEGDLLAVQSAGAYAFAMASTYNSRPLPAEIMVDGDRDWVVRERDTWEDLVRKEVDV